MPNNLSFEVEFTRQQMENMLATPSVETIVVSGTYTHNPGNGMWNMQAFAEGFNADKSEMLPTREEACIQPCPRI